MKTQHINPILIRKDIASALEKIYNDWKKNGVVSALFRYETSLFTHGMIRKLPDMGVLKRLTTSKKNMSYEWIGEDNLNFEELARKLMLRPGVKKQEESSCKIENNRRIIKIALILQKAGVDENKIYEIVHQINLIP
jgi:hypothetical protein